MLTKDHRDDALMILARAFCTEPLTSSLGEIRPEMKVTLEDWIEFMDFFMDESSTNGLSVICIDTDKHRIAGAFIVKDLLMEP